MSADDGVFDLGSGVAYRKFQWAPERDINPQYEGIEDIPWAGITVIFDHGTDHECEGGVTFDVMKKVSPKGIFWTVDSWDPLTLSPSIQCREHPHHHGFIKEGKWVQA